MARNGSGVYSLPAGSTIANGDLSDASDLNTPLSDIETDLNTPRPIVAGGTGASSASAARTALGLAIGTDVQAYDADLASWAGVTRASGFDTFAATPSSANLRALLTDEVGTGAAYFVGGALGTPASGVLTNCTGLPFAGLAAAAVVTEAEGISSNDNDTTIPTSAAVKAYADTRGGYTMLTQVATTSGTAFDFTVPATATELIVDLDQVSLSGSDSILIQLIDGGGAQTTGYLSRGNFVGTAGGLNSTAGIVVFVGAATDSAIAPIAFNKMNGNKWIADYTGVLVRAGAGLFGLQGSGIVTLDDACVGVRITRTGTDTFDAGSVNVGWR